MAMAAAAATVCVASPSSSSFSARASSSRKCGISHCGASDSRVQIASSVRSYAITALASAPVPSSFVVKASGCSSGAASAISRLSSSRPRSRECRWQAVAEQLEAETEEASEEGIPSDTLSIFFEAEGSLPEASVAKLTSTLEEVEGVSNVNIIACADGTATVKLTKQMNVQATGVASGLVDVLLKGGFKLQALNLGFDEEDGDDDELYEYDVASSTEESEVAE